MLTELSSALVRRQRLVVADSQKKWIVHNHFASDVHFRRASNCLLPSQGRGESEPPSKVGCEMSWSTDLPGRSKFHTRRRFGAVFGTQSLDLRPPPPPPVPLLRHKVKTGLSRFTAAISHTQVLPPTPAWAFHV